jgi:hypothetical protein
VVTIKNTMRFEMDGFAGECFRRVVDYFFFF